jgi:glycosyltransferase involved in cell wall biosynthesis
VNLRVGLFTYGMKDYLTGIGRYTVELAYGLKRTGLPIEVVLVSPYPESTLPWYRDFEVYPVPTLRRLPYVLLNGDRELSRAARRLQLDILHDPCGIAPFFRPHHDFATVVTIHDAIPLAYPKHQPLLTKLVFHTFLKGARWTTDAVITDSTSSATDIARFIKVPQANLHVTALATSVPSLGKLRAMQERVPQVLAARGITSPYFLVVGAQNPRKNAAGVLAAFHQIKESRPNIALVVAGSHTERTLPRTDGVRHLGYVDDELLGLLYVGATALVFPSFYEGFGIPLLEAMAHGTPVITSNTSSMREVAGSAALLVDPHDTQSIAAAMAQCLDPALSAQLGLSGRLWVRHFSWDDTALKTWRVYQSILRPSAAERIRYHAI